jgi:hypothetical protein
MLEKAASALRRRATLVASRTARFRRNSSIWLLVRQALACRTLDEDFGAAAVGALAAVAAKAELVHVLVKMLADVVVDAL